MKNCPFCGGTARAAVTHPAPLYAAVCESCCARGPLHETAEGAIAGWDTRPPFGRFTVIPEIIRRAPPDITNQQDPQ